MKAFQEPDFQNRFFGPLPGSEGSAFPSRQTPGVVYSSVAPSPVRSPELLIASPEVAAELDLDFPPTGSGPFAELFVGNQIPAGARPYATRYGGHQFGHWAGQLGDGRAISLGEIQNSKGQFLEVQLKGAGPTPYSRRADGRAVLRSSLREFLCSEAMAHLGIPTTRALCCVTTGEPVIRDLFYDGNPEPEPGAITTRVAPSFLRFGHFEILATSGEIDLLRKLLERTLEIHFPNHTASTPEGIASWLGELCSRTAHLMSEWLRVGFVHGVMNTDNLSILGLTIDYGPYGWMDDYDPQWTPNTTDAQNRRYRFGNQPTIALWNLSRLAESLLPLFQDPDHGVTLLQPALQNYGTEFRGRYLKMILSKLGLSSCDHQEGVQLIEQLERNLTLVPTDPTLFYRSLASVLPQEDSPESALLKLKPAFEGSTLAEATHDHWITWLQLYLDLSNRDPQPRQGQVDLMNSVNPAFILRNYIVQEALDALERGDRSVLDRVFQALKTPYELNEKTSTWFKRIPDWAKNRPGCSALSCSS